MCVLCIISVSHLLGISLLDSQAALLALLALNKEIPFSRAMEALLIREDPMRRSKKREGRG